MCSPLKDMNVPIVFILGGPGCGKGTQCAKIVETYGFTHLSSGDLLRDEVKSGSERGKSLNAKMEKGELVPMETVLELLKEAIIKALPNSKGFLIDGYPREVCQGVQFEEQIGPCSLVIFFDVSDEVMMQRLLDRGKSSGRVDDNQDTIKQRLKTFHDVSEPVAEHYNDKCVRICADKSPECVFEEVMKIMSQLAEEKANVCA